MLEHFLLVLLFSFTPSIIWLSFYLREDVHPEPRRWISIAFLSGVGAVPVALAIEQTLVRRLAIPIETFTIEALAMLVAIAFIEEALKFLSVWVLMKNNPVFDEAIDAVIYMITASLGFAALENMFLFSSFGAESLVSQGLSTMVFRLIGAVFLHTLASAIIGFGWAFSLIAKNRRQKCLRLGAGIATATLLHAAFNAAILWFGPWYMVPVTVTLFVVGLVILHEFDILRSLNTPI
jgi:RsiW-degrading membrane proteinase PrsW (M82 family)